MWTEPILHVDMDSFFVEVERLRDPGLMGRPVAVGGAGPRGVIASASYEARHLGVHSAQPTSVARRVCPNLVVVPPDHGRYHDVSAEVFGVFRAFTPMVEGLSLDEAFLDVRGLRLHYGSPVEVGESVRTRIKSEFGLPASVGAASVKFLAKLASQAAKPDGLRHVPADSQMAFLHALPANALWGVGPATRAALTRLGVETIGDIAGLDVNTLVGAVGPATGRHLHDLANGRDPREVVPDTAAKSVSVEETYNDDLRSSEVIETALLSHALHLSGRLRRSGLRARTISLKVRYPDFRTVTRAQTMGSAVDGTRDLYRIAVDLLTAVDRGDTPVRLLGLGGSSLEPATDPNQLHLGANRWAAVEDAAADVRDRFGDAAVRPARLLDGQAKESVE